MSNIDNTIEPDALMWKFFDNEASGEEKTLLLAWVKRSDENKRLFQEARATYVATKYPDVDAAFDHDRAFQAFTRETRAKTFPIKLVISAAACVAVLLGFGIAYLTMKPSVTTYITYASGQTDTKEVSLPDGSSVLMNRGTTLGFADNTKETREVKLRGEASFDVKHDPAKPFSVFVDKLQVKVLGTSFIVDAKPGCDSVIVRVLSGRVVMISPSQSLILSANQTAVYKKTGDKLLPVSNFDKNAISWKTKELYFNATPLSKVAQTLGEYFGKNIVVAGDDVARYPLSVQLDNPNLDSVLQLLQLTFNIKAVKTDSAIILQENKINN